MCVIGDSHLLTHPFLSSLVNTKVSVTTNMDALRDALPNGLPLSVLSIVTTLLLGIVYTVLTQEKPLAGFPLASLEGKGPKKSWLWHGSQLIQEFSEKVIATTSWCHVRLLTTSCSTPDHSFR